ncbi:unnamed protein product [Rotaria magnacalcarata]
MPSCFISSLRKQINDTTHSHYVYLKTKVHDLQNMLDRFAAVEKNLPIFRKRFREAINRRYDHLSEQELFSGEGIIKKEIFNHLKSNENADDDWKDRPAKSGHGTDRKGNGNKGEDRYNGKPGKSAGHAYIVANKLPRINISAVSGKGGRGQHGGDGVKGLDDKDGKDADKEALLEKAQHRDILYSERAVRVRRKGIDGKPGSSGGDAGDSGVVKLVGLDKIL